MMRGATLEAILHNRKWLYGFLLGVGTLAATELSLVFYSAPAAFPLHAGFALAGLVIAGINLWPALFLAFFIVYGLNDSSLLITLALAVGNTLQAVTGAYVLKRLQFQSDLGRMRDILLIMLVAIFASTIVPTLGTLGHLFNGTVPGLKWGAWWTGHIMSLLIVSPLLIRWIAGPNPRPRRQAAVETAIVFSLLLVINFVLFISNIPRINGLPLVYLLLIPLFWISLRLGPRSTTAALFITSVMALIGAALYVPTSGATSLGERLAQLQIFLEVLAVIFFIVAAISEERQRANENLARHIRQLETALDKIQTQDKAKSDFIAVLAHELRNPLTPIMASVDLLKRKLVDDQSTMKLLNLMDSRTKIIHRLLEDLLDVTRISQDKMQLKREKSNLCSLVRQAITSVDPKISERKQHLDINLPSQTVSIEADPLRIEQVVTNLLTNASKFTPEGGAISVSVLPHDYEAELVVRDNGKGINQTMLERIFEPFLQIEAQGQLNFPSNQAGFSNKPSNDGLGIGLSLVKKLVHMHGGSIEAKSLGEGKGSEFVVRLPLVAE